MTFNLKYGNFLDPVVFSHLLTNAKKYVCYKYLEVDMNFADINCTCIVLGLQYTQDKITVMTVCSWIGISFT